MDEDWSELVLDIVDRVPAGQATTYGLVAEAARVVSDRGSARQVGTVLATRGEAVPWWRVVRADGTLPEQLRRRAAERYEAEGTPLRPAGAVDLPRAGWDPLEVTDA